MDVARPDIAIAKRKKRNRLIIISVIVLAGVTYGLSRLKPAVPTVDRNLVYIDTVKRGPLVRQVQGSGTLVPEDIRWITSRASGRVDKVVLRPGAKVEPDSVIVILYNTEVAQTANQADTALKVAEAELANLKFQLEGDLLSAEASAYSRENAYLEAKATNDGDKRLFAKNFITPSDLRKSESNLANAEKANEAEKKRLAFTKDGLAPRLAAKSASVEQLRATAKLRREEVEGLQVKAGMTGVLQVMSLQIGSQVGSGTNLARVADPSRLKAEVRVAETQAKDVRIGQVATVDTRNGIVPARVARIDPAVLQGTVTVDLEITGDLPAGARPDLSVDGIVELERLTDVIFTARPSFGIGKGTVGIFRLEEDGIHAQRVPVQLGRSSVNSVEVVKGLEPGDRIILSDMSQWDGTERIKLK